MSNLTKIGTRKDTSKNEKNFIIKRPVQSKNYAFAKSGVVAAGKYRSFIIDVEFTKTKAGEDAVDLLYDLTDQKGTTYHVRMRYPDDSYYYAELCGALLDAGLQEGDSLKKAIGIEESIVLEYVNGEKIGSITARAPISEKAVNGKTAEIDEADDTDEDYDDLEEDDLVEDEE